MKGKQLVVNSLFCHKLDLLFKKQIWKLLLIQHILHLGMLGALKLEEYILQANKQFFSVCKY